MKWQNHVGTRTYGLQESLYEKIDSNIRCLITNSGSVYADNKQIFFSQMEPTKQILAVEALEHNTMKSQNREEEVGDGSVLQESPSGDSSYSWELRSDWFGLEQ